MNFRKFLLLSTLFFTIAINSFATDFYWVGNDGNWNDASHWSSTSGGNGGAGIPTENDDVFFDVNSANSNIKIQSDISIKDLILKENIARLSISSESNTSINIYGSIDIQGTFINEIKSSIHFKNNLNTLHNMDFGRFIWKSDFYFEGTGSYLFESSLQAHNNDIYFNEGFIDLNTFDIFCSSFISNTKLKRKLISKKSTILVYNYWKTSKTKFNYDFSQTKIYVISPDIKAIEKNGDNYSITQSASSSGPEAILTFNLENDTVSCGLTSDGELTIDFTTDCANALVDWVPQGSDDYTGECFTCPIPGPNGSNTITGLAPGTYTAVITNDCDGVIQPVIGIVQGHAAIVELIHTETPPFCNGICNGSAFGFYTGEVYAEFGFSWLGQGVNDTTTTLANICAGLYQLEVVDGFGCIDTFDFNITEPDSMYANVTVTDPLCFNEATGTATSNPTGGTSPYFYSWTPPTGDPALDTVQTFNNLSAGNTYTINVTDANGCVNDTTFTPNQPDQIQVDTTLQHVSCGGLADGSITATVLSGGITPYNHSWSNGQIDLNTTSSTINSLIAGNYSDTITDGNGCDTVLLFTITEPIPLITATNPTNITCNNTCDGTATTSPSGGSAISTFVWASIPAGLPFNGQGTDSIFNLCVGQYFVVITDINLCTVSDTITITEPSMIVTNVSSTDITCPGFDDGTATASPTGGIGNPAIDFTYSWTGPGCSAAPYNTQTINFLCAGDYIVTITDSVGCSILDTVTISEPPALNLVMNFTSETCFDACDGGVGVATIGGTGNPAIDFTFLWTSVPGGQVTNGQGTDTISGLCAGTYTVFVTDSVGCTNNNNVVITPQITIDGNLITSDLSCNGICNGSATISPTGGSGPYTISWDGALAINIPIAGSNTINTLCAGPHTALITDDNGCPLLINFNLSEPLPITTSTVKNDVSCFGLCDGDAITTPAGGTAPYTTSWDMIPTAAGFPNTNNPINGLCSGIYFVTVTDDSLCVVSDTVEIFEPLEIFPNAIFTGISCNGLSDGTATSLPTGGSPGYTFNWSGPGGFSSNLQAINSLIAGQYIITVTDTNGCSAMDTVNILDPPALTVNASATAASCGAVCDGTALATVNGGTAGFSFLWTGPNGPFTGNPATGLCIGIYTVTVTDTNGCIAQDTTEIVPQIQITINPTIIGISCNGVCDGTATVFPVGGTQPYTYLWNVPPPNTDSIVTGLCPGFVSVTVTDGIGCSVTDSILMPVAPSVLQTGGTILQQVSCPGACDAQVAHSPTGGTAPYTSVWTLPFGNDTNNVCPTSAIITVTDDNNCVQSDTLIINEPTPIIPNAAITDVLCNGDLTGSITFAPTGGTGGYTYVWLPNVSITNSATGLGAGIYQITISDNNGCAIIINDTVNEPSVLSAIPVGIDISCFGLCDGMASVIVNGGTQGYTYSWAPNGEVTDTIFNLCSPNLTNSVTITDTNGCITSQTITINEPTALLANVSGTSIGCDGACIGTALSTPSGGTSGYTFQWSTNASPNILTNPNISNLCLGNYLVTVTDANGCIDTATHTVTSPPPLDVNLDSTNVTCNGENNGTATATTIGGTAPFTFSWVGGTIIGSNPNPTITNLIPGIYTVTVTDSFGCIFIGSVNITEPTTIDDNEVVVTANCNVGDGSITMFPSGGNPPYNHSWSNGSTSNPLQNLTAGFYTDTITDALGCIAIFTIPVTNPAGPSGITSTVNDATCFETCDASLNVIVIGGTAPFNYAWASIPAGGPYPNDSTLNNLCAGTFNLTVTEVGSGCILAESIIVGEADSISENSTFTAVSCNGTCDGTASVTPTGGTAPYTFLWSTGAMTSSVSGLCTGPASVTITDFNNCTKVVNFIIGTPTALTLTTTNTATTCNGTCDGTATVNPVGGTGTYTFQWNDPSAQTTQTATGLCPGAFIVTVTDVNGCSNTATVTIIDASPILANEITTGSTCGNSDGTASVCSASGGAGTYTFNWTTLGNVNVCNVAGLTAGTYPVIITDAGGCSETFLITISDINGPIVTVNTTNARCNGVCDGTATAAASGVPNFSYLWQTGNQVTPGITGLCAGNYTVEVTDGNGCITTEPVIITDNIAITATVSTTEPTCNGDCDGSALVIPDGGIPSYNYSWTGGNAAGQTINAVGGLCAGNYTTTITDDLGCSFIQNVTINEPNILSVSTSGIAANCSGSCDGQATATPTGGTAPYTFSWSNSNTTPTIIALCAGSYTVTVTDSNGCTATSTVIIGDGIPITATITKIDVTGTAVNCTLCDGSITVSNIAGGSGGPYTFLWSPGAQNTTTINNLCPGAYSLLITDNAGCTQLFNVLINNQNGQASLITDAIDVTCFGDCDGVAFTTPIGGLSTIALFQWDDPNLTTNDTAIALCAGFYTVIVQDVLGCITVDSITVNEPAEVVPNTTFTNPTCNGICDGTATVSPTSGVGPYTVSWDGALPISIAIGASDTITGLCSGAHTALITDVNNCSILEDIILTDPTTISITASTTSVSCNGDCDGTAIANASGGNPGYSYSWNTTPVQNNSLIGGLCPGNYTVTVTDNNGCTNTADVTVIDPPILTTTSTSTPPSCNGGCDGSITTNPSGGSAPYRYVWSNGDTTQTTNNLCVGVYNVIVIDANNCTVNDTITITDPILLDAGLNQTDPTCGICDGTITSTPIGGSGAFDFIWTNSLVPSLPIQTDLGTATSTLIGLCASSYNLQITDVGTGCISNYTVLLNDGNGPTLTLTSTDETCTSACDGTATATPTGGTAPYSYSWSPTGPPIDTNQTAAGLCDGFYTVTVTDSAGCISSDTISINTSVLDLTITSVVPETCFGDCDGSATVSVAGGTPSYMFLWDANAANQPTAQALNLCVGSYTVTVTDALNCSNSISTNITGPDSLTVAATVNIPLNCFGICDGALIANALGGTPNYAYLWNDPLAQTTQIATGLCAGTYTVVVTDDNGCSATSTITLTDPTPILANETFINPDCGICDGSITLNPSGGNGPYTFLWTTPTAPVLAQPVTASIINLCAGAYSVIITDALGCSATFNYPLSNTNAPIPVLTSTPPSCNGVCDGSITSTTTGGNGAYTYFWNPTSEITPNITNLCAGIYTLNVTDAIGCIGVAIDSLIEPDAIQTNLTGTNINCNGVCDGTATTNIIGGTSPYTFAWSPSTSIDSAITGLCAGTHTVTVTDANGCTVIDDINILEPTSITVTTTKIDGSCTSLPCDGQATVTPANGTGPYTFQWNGDVTPGQLNTQSNLCFGPNFVEIFDQNGCSIVDTINIGATDTILADAGADATICIGDFINLNGVATGSSIISVEWFSLPGMISIGNTDSIITTPPNTGVFCYVYQVTGACVFSDTVCVTVEALPIADAGLDENIFENESTVLNATGGGTYSWSPGTELSDTSIFNPTASPDVTTTYYVSVTSPNGCVAIDSVTITVLPAINFPDGITPNGDGKNDVWIIDFIEEYPDNVVEIYNRWGELLFHADGYQQDWDGTYEGKELPIGTYYYIIDLNDESIKPFTGPLTILR